MNPLSADDFVTWADRLAKLSWPLTLDAFRSAAVGFGWSPTDRPWEFVVDFSSGMRRMVLYGGRSGGIHNMSFPLAEPAEDATPLDELLVSYETTGTQAWGKPFYTAPCEDPTIAWRLPNNAVAEIVGGSDLILSTFFTPQGSFIYG